MDELAREMDVRFADPEPPLASRFSSSSEDEAEVDEKPKGFFKRAANIIEKKIVERRLRRSKSAADMSLRFEDREAPLVPHLPAAVARRLERRTYALTGQEVSHNNWAKPDPPGSRNVRYINSPEPQIFDSPSTSASPVAFPWATPMAPVPLSSAPIRPDSQARKRELHANEPPVLNLGPRDDRSAPRSPLGSSSTMPALTSVHHTGIAHNKKSHKNEPLATMPTMRESPETEFLQLQYDGPSINPFDSPEPAHHGSEPRTAAALAHHGSNSRTGAAVAHDRSQPPTVAATADHQDTMHLNTPHHEQMFVNPRRAPDPSFTPTGQYKARREATINARSRADGEEAVYSQRTQFNANDSAAFPGSSFKTPPLSGRSPIPNAHIHPAFRNRLQDAGTPSLHMSPSLNTQVHPASRDREQYSTPRQSQPQQMSATLHMAVNSEPLRSREMSSNYGPLQPRRMPSSAGPLQPRRMAFSAEPLQPRHMFSNHEPLQHHHMSPSAEPLQPRQMTSRSLEPLQPHQFSSGHEPSQPRQGAFSHEPLQPHHVSSRADLFQPRHMSSSAEPLQSRLFPSSQEHSQLQHTSINDEPLHLRHVSYSLKGVLPHYTSSSSEALQLAQASPNPDLSQSHHITSRHEPSQPQHMSSNIDIYQPHHTSSNIEPPQLHYVSSSRGPLNSHQPLYNLEGLQPHMSHSSDAFQSRQMTTSPDSLQLHHMTASPDQFQQREMIGPHSPSASTSDDIDRELEEIETLQANINKRVQALKAKKAAGERDALSSSTPATSSLGTTAHNDERFPEEVDADADNPNTTNDVTIPTLLNAATIPTPLNAAIIPIDWSARKPDESAEDFRNRLAEYANTLIKLTDDSSEHDIEPTVEEIEDALKMWEDIYGA